jgi:hypothetical protein
MLTCLKCMKIDRPEVFVIERNVTAPLCDKHGVAMVNLVERIPFVPTAEQLGDAPDEPDEILEDEPDPGPPKEEAEDIPSFEEIDGMTKKELVTLSHKLNLSVSESMNKASIVEGIKAALLNP